MTEEDRMYIHRNYEGFLFSEDFFMESFLADNVILLEITPDDTYSNLEIIRTQHIHLDF